MPRLDHRTGRPPGFSVERKRGLDTTLSKSHIKILASKDGGIDRGHAKSVMATLIRDHPKFDGVVTLDDDMMVGALIAMHDAGIDPTKKVKVSVDAVPETDSFVRAGDLSATLDPLEPAPPGSAPD